MEKLVNDNKMIVIIELIIDN